MIPQELPFSVEQHRPNYSYFWTLDNGTIWIKDKFLRRGHKIAKAHFMLIASNGPYPFRYPSGIISFTKKKTKKTTTVSGVTCSCKTYCPRFCKTKLVYIRSIITYFNFRYLDYSYPKTVIFTCWS